MPVTLVARRDDESAIAPSPPTGTTMTSPRFAYRTMLRASSEIAVATMVASPEENPSRVASVRPRWRAVTMSVSDATVTRASSTPAGRSVIASSVLPCALEKARAPPRGRAWWPRPPGSGPAGPSRSATSGSMPTITVSAPRSLIICAMSRRVRLANESITSSAVTSTITPRERYRPTCSTSDSRSCSRSASVSADWMLAMRYGPLLQDRDLHRARGSAASAHAGGGASLTRHDLVPEQALRLLDAALQVADRRHLAEVDADVDRVWAISGDRPGDDDRGAEQPRRLDRLHEVVGHAGVHRRHARDVDDDDLGAIGPDARAGAAR